MQVEVILQLSENFPSKLNKHADDRRSFTLLLIASKANSIRFDPIRLGFRVKHFAFLGFVKLYLIIIVFSIAIFNAIARIDFIVPDKVQFNHLRST